MVTRIQKWGNSLGLRLPKSAAQEAGVSAGSSVDVRVRSGEIVVAPIRAPYALGDLLDRITSQNIHDEADFGLAAGKEQL